MAQVLKASEENLKIAAEVIRKGGLVAFPTETVYGLGGDAFNPDAVARIFEVKERPSFDPIIDSASFYAFTLSLIPFKCPVFFPSTSQTLPCIFSLSLR